MLAVVALKGIGYGVVVVLTNAFGGREIVVVVSQLIIECAMVVAMVDVFGG